jgi:hypothetical protein
MADKIEPPDWIYPGAKIFLVDLQGISTITAIRNALVERISPQSFLVRYRVNGHEITSRIRLSDLRSGTQGSVWESWFQRVADPQSELGIELQRLRDFWGTRNRVINAVKAVSQNFGLDNEEAVQRAIDALTEWRDAPGPSLTGWPEEK